MKVTQEMVDRFLAWTLPKDFAPDAGIKFTPSKTHPDARPIGTNLFTDVQATEMLEHILADVPDNAEALANAQGAIDDLKAVVTEQEKKLAGVEHLEAERKQFEVAKAEAMKQVSGLRDVFRANDEANAAADSARDRLRHAVERFSL